MRLECVVEFDAPHIIALKLLTIIISGFGLAVEVVVSIEFDVLLYSYACFSHPELSTYQSGCIKELRHIPSSNAANVCAWISIYIVNAQSPRTNFIGINFAIGQASSPHSCIIKILAIILNVVAINSEITYIECCTYSPSLEILRYTADISELLFSLLFKVESREVSYAANIATGFNKPSFWNISINLVIFVKIVIPLIINAFETAITSANVEFAIIIGTSNAVENTIFIHVNASLRQTYPSTTKIKGQFISWGVNDMDTIHFCISRIVSFEVSFCRQTAFNTDFVVNLTRNVQTHTSAISVIQSILWMLVLHTSIAGPGDVADFLFEVGYANAEVCEFVSVFASEFVKGSLLFCIQLVFFCHQASDDLSQFVTGHVSFALERAVRIAFYDALNGQVGYCLECPVIRGNIRKRICSVSGYASGECCYSSQCEDLFHLDSLLI